VRSPSTFQEYLSNDITASQASLDADGYWRTGDIGYISSKSKQWYIVGRAKEVFKTNNLGQVSPAELEALLCSHPKIHDAVVAPLYAEGKLDDIKIKAYVVRKEGEVLSEEEVITYVQAKVAKWKELDEVTCVESVARNAMGKIERWRYDEMLRGKMR